MSYRSSRSNGGGLIFFGLLICLPALLWTGLRMWNSVVFDIHCEGHIKRAADANTVKMAETELDESLKYLEANHMTRGYTAVLWHTPDTDVGFWYNNLKSSREELGKVTDETSQLERTNVLMKLRETLLDHGDKGDHVTMPSGISVFPNNAAYFWSGWLVFLMFIAGAIMIFAGISVDNQRRRFDKDGLCPS